MEEFGGDSTLGTTFQGGVRMSTRPHKPPERYLVDYIE